MKESRPPLRYRCLLAALSPLILLATLREMKRRNGGWKYLQQRFGFGMPAFKTSPLWIHAASVGEVNAAWPLLQEILAATAQTRILITTNTPTAARRVLALAAGAAGNITHRYLPLDYRCLVRRFLHAVNPQCALLMETELWPNLIAECRERNIPVYLVNGRLDKTLALPAFLKPPLQYSIANIAHILARTQTDQTHFVRLGADVTQVSTLGNIKFAAADKQAVADITLPKPFVLAASTHADEEKQLAALWLSLKRRDYLLVIAPRHPERRDAILKKLTGLPLNIAVRSRNDKVTNDTDIYLADTLGELTAFITNATLVFMGGSLVPKGGQNILEPAYFGKAIVTGPHTFNFRAEVAELLEQHALIQVKDARELQSVIEKLLDKPDEARKLGENAKTLMLSRGDIAKRYYRALKDLGAFQKKQNPEHSP